MMRNLILLPLLCLTIAAQAQYSETFSVAGKGYKLSCADDFTSVNWSLSPWSSPSCAPGDNRDASDYFNTTAAGTLEGIDLDQEVYWESPLINTTAANPVSLKMDLSWVEFDTDIAANNCSTDWIRVEYSVNGGAYVMIPNVHGGNACATVSYPFQDPAPAPGISGNFMINQAGITGGSTLKVRVRVFTNQNAEKVIIDNVAVPEAGVTVGCAAPVLSTVVTQVGCSNPNSGAIDLSVSAGTPPFTYSWTGGATTQDLSNKPTGTYTVTVSDAASCSATISATITNAPAITLTTLVLDASCSGNMDGEVSLEVAGGVPGYTYDWSNDGPETPDNDPQDLVNLGTGTYTVTVTDASGCTKTASATVGILPSGAYLEQFNTPNKGYLPGYVDDFAGVAWTMGPWSPAPPAPFGRETGDYFRTSGGVLVGIDFDQEICWTSPLIDLNGGTQFSVGLSWLTFDQEDYINVNYSIDGGAFVQVANVVGGGTGTIDYPVPTIDQSGSTTVTKTGLSGGTIQIQVCGNFNSESMTVDNVNIPGSNNYCPAPEPSLSATNVTCNGAANGTITTTVVNGSAPYTYAWSDGSVTTQNRTGLAPGTYTVTVTDANMATGTASTVITQPTAIVLTETHVNVLCNGASTGSIDLTPTGGTGAYSYSWTGGATTQDRSSLAAGTYTVTVTDANACTKTLSVTITQPTAIVLTETHVNVLCNGASTGSIDLGATGGTGAYLYSWTGGATTQDRSGLAAGTYTVTVSDANTCTKTLSVTITQPTAIVLTETHVNILCNGGSNGSIDLTAAGGTGAYTYSWTGGATTEDRSGLVAGTYTVTVTDANICTKTLSVTITEPPALTLTETHVNVLCNGASTGSIDLTVSGGTGAYNYSWTGGATTQDRSGIAAGTYTVTVTDANSCTKTLSVTITEPAGGIVLTETHVNVLCNGASTGSIDLTATGGTGAYTYSWTGGATTQDRSGLAAGTYTVTVSDANTCTKTLSVTITQPTSIVLTETHVNVLCNGGSNGSIDLTAAGGTGAYTYSWTGGATTEDRSGLVAGTYTVTVTDANICTKTLSVTITEPPALTLTETHVNVLCNGASTGSIDLTVSGGTGAYNYSWTGGATTQDRSGIAAGTYTVTVTDANNCTKTLSVTITEPAGGIVLTETHVNVLCNGATTGSIDLIVSGGTPGYTYSWTGGATTQDRSGLAAGTYTVTVTDANFCSKTLSATITENTAIVLTETHVNVLCNGGSTGSIDLTVSGGTSGYTYSWTGGATTQDRSGLAAGTYTVTVTDANACTKTLSTTITQPTAIVLSSTQVNVLCNGNSTGSIDLAVSGGTGAYSYFWTGGATTQDRSGLASGTYTVTVSDANSCTKTLSVTITEPTAIVLSTTQMDVLCNGNATGSIDLTVSGGVSPYTYNWGGGISTQDRSGLSVGTYCVTVTDNNACTKTICATITETSPIVLSATQVNVFCNGNSTGSIDLSVSGGTPGYSYSWTGGATTQDRSGLAAGTYTVTVTDVSNCTKTTSVTITQPTAIVLSTTQVNVLCNGNATGSIDLSVSGGTPGYTYAWTGGPTTQDRSGLIAGTYTVTVTDANACTKTTSVTITQPTALSLSSSIVNPSNCFVADGSIDLSVSGGTSGYTYDWSNDGPETPDNDTQDLLNMVEGTYTVTVTDANGCTATHARTLDYIDIVPPSISCPANVTINANASCAGMVGSYSPLSVSDNCNLSPSVTQIPAPSTSLNGHNDVETVTLTANDGNGNMQSCSLTVTLKDVTPPSITCPANVNINANASCAGTVGSYSPLSVSDNCNPSPSVTQSPASSTALNGHNDVETVTLTANDGNGNTQFCTFTVTLKDVTPPNITCPGNITLNANASCSATIGSYLPATLVDNCNPTPTASQSPAAGTVISGANAVLSVFLTGSDGNGNTQNCNFTITLKDVTAPTVVCKPFTANLNATGMVSIVPANVFQSGADNCGTVNLASVTPNSFTCSNIGANLVTLTVNDGNGNNATCNAIVTVSDVTAPVAKCKDITANLGVNGTVTVAPSLVNNGTTDNCSFTLTLTPNTFNCSNVGIVNTVVLRATDAGGNSATCTAKVTVKDLLGPTAKCKNPTIFLDALGQATLSAAQVNNGSTDACGITTMSINDTQFNCSELAGSPWPVTLSLSDVNGNSSSCLAYVTVKDAIAPTAVCEDVTVALGPSGYAVVYCDDLTPNSTDNCAVWSCSPTAKVYTTANLGNNNLTVTVKDYSNNSSTCVSVVTVVPYGTNNDFQQGGGGKGHEILYSHDLLVFPNPTSGDAEMAFQLPADQSFVCRIFDTSGRMVYSHEDRGVEGENRMTLRLEGLAPGLYVVDFQSEEWRIQKRLVIQE